MVLTMMFRSSTVKMMIVDPEDLDFAKMGAIGWIHSVLATVAAKMETIDLLH